MQKQIKINEQVDLLKADGTLNAKGYATRNIFNYNRENIPRRLKNRLKEWDFYQLSDGNYMVQISFFNISLASCASLTLLDLKSGKKTFSSKIIPFTANSYRLPKNGDLPHRFEFLKGKIKLVFDAEKDTRKIFYSDLKKKIYASFTLYETDRESIVIATPFKQKGRFFLTQKLNCMPTEGCVEIKGNKIPFEKDKTFTVLDWGRGVWPHSNCWYWGNGSAYVDGKLFGFELTWGFGIEDYATETAIFYDGKCEKLSAVRLETPPQKNYLAPWHFISDDGKFDMTMTPFYDYKNGAVFLGLVGMKSHQVHGLWSGTVKLDSGKTLEIKDMYAFCEYVVNKW